MIQEEDLKKSLDQLDVILQSVDDGITVQEPDGRIIYANAAAERLIGFSPVDTPAVSARDEMLEQFELFDERGRRLSVDDLPSRRAMRGEEPGDVLLRYRRYRGS